MGDIISNFFNDFIFGFIVTVGDIIDTVVGLMRMLLGLDALEGDGSTHNLVLSTLTNGAVIRAFLIILALAFVSVFIFALIRVLRSQISEEKDDGGISKAKSVKGILYSIIQMVILPAFCIVLVLSVTAFAQAIDVATGGSKSVSYSTEIIFSIVEEDMLEEDVRKTYYNNGVYVMEEDANGNARYVLVKEMDAVKAVWDNKAFKDNTGGSRYEKISHDYDGLCSILDQDEYFKSWLLPLLGGCVMVFALGMSTIVVGQRLFYCVFLFIQSPYIVATRPLDDGARWKKWCEIFISKLIGSFAIIIALNVFFLISSSLTTLNFFVSSNWFANGVTKLVIYISGVIAAAGAPQLVAQLIGSDAGTQERDQAINNFRTMMGGAQLARGAIRGAGALAKGAGNFFAGKKNTPLSSVNSGESLNNGAPNGAGESNGAVANPVQNRGMAQTLGNIMLGRTSVGDTAKTVGNKIKTSRPVQIAKGAGLLVMGTVALPYTIGKGIHNSFRNRREGKHPDQRLRRMMNERGKMKNPNGKDFIRKDLRKK